MSHSRACALTIAFGLLALTTAPAAAQELQWGGFASLRAASNTSGPLDSDPAGAQLQLGLDWVPSPVFLAHAHLVARSDDGDAQHGHFGTPEAYLELNLRPGSSRIRLRGGAFFLPTSRENIDALWENPYTVSSSALNTWFGEELRPIGLDATWQHGGAVVGGTIFRGNETFGALPVDRGWALHDRWTFLGEKVASGDYYTSLTAENDGRLGWSARGGWNAASFSVLYTHIDNRSDGQLYGDLYNWATRFDLVGADWGHGDWTVASEFGWGPTTLFYPGGSVTLDLGSGYLLVSRRLPRGRLSARFDAWKSGEERDQALTLAGFWYPIPRLRAGLEVGVTQDTARVLVDLRYGFSR